MQRSSKAIAKNLFFGEQKKKLEWAVPPLHEHFFKKKKKKKNFFLFLAGGGTMEKQPFNMSGAIKKIRWFFRFA